MFNTYPYNSQPYNYTTIPVSLTQDSIVFDGYSLQNANIVTSMIDYDDQGQVEINQFNYPRSNGGGVLSKYYRGRTITLNCTIKSDTRDSFETLLDTTKKGLRKTEGFLDIKVGEEIRRIKATLKEFKAMRQHYNVSMTRATIQFQAVEPFFYAVGKQSFEFLDNVSSFSGEVENTGSADTAPIFYFIGTAGSSITNISVTHKGKTMAIPTTISQNDIIIIDSENTQVTKNGVGIDYTGFFPVFEPGSCPFTVTTVGTTALDLTLVMNKNYL